MPSRTPRMWAAAVVTAALIMGVPDGARAASNVQAAVSVQNGTLTNLKLLERAAPLGVGRKLTAFRVFRPWTDDITEALAASKEGRRIIISFTSILPGDTPETNQSWTWKQVAAGNQDAMLDKIGVALSKLADLPNGQHHLVTYYHEPNITLNNTTRFGTAADYRAALARFVARVHAKAPKVDFYICLTPKPFRDGTAEQWIAKTTPALVGVADDGYGYSLGAANSTFESIYSPFRAFMNSKHPSMLQIVGEFAVLDQPGGPTRVQWLKAAKAYIVNKWPEVDIVSYFDVISTAQNGITYKWQVAPSSPDMAALKDFYSPFA